MSIVLDMFDVNVVVEISEWTKLTIEEKDSLLYTWRINN